MRISLKLLLMALTALIIYIFPQEVAAQERLSFYYVQYDEEGTLTWRKSYDSIEPGASADEQALHLFASFFSSELPVSVPEGTRLLQAYIIEDELYLNVSKEILQYGGTYNETVLTEQIMKTAKELEGITKISLMIEGWISPLPEGTILQHTPLKTGEGL